MKYDSNTVRWVSKRTRAVPVSLCFCAVVPAKVIWQRAANSRALPLSIREPWAKTDSNTSCTSARACSGIPNISYQERWSISDTPSWKLHLSSNKHTGILNKHFTLGEIKQLGDVLWALVSHYQVSEHCWCTCVNARCNTVSEVKLCRLCWRDRARACKSNGRPDANPDESQWSSAEASITLPHKHTEEFKTGMGTLPFQQDSKYTLQIFGVIKIF